MPSIGPDAIARAAVADVDYIQVVAAAILNERGECLIARRPPHVHQGDKWEFPGGKAEPGELAEQALTRELHEELGITAEAIEPLIRVRHRYPDKAVQLDVWRVTAFSGHPHGREGQPVRWVDVDRLPDVEFPAANRPIIQALRLPDRYLITPDPGDDLDQFLDGLRSSLASGGLRLVQLRAKRLSEDQLQALASEALTLCRRFNAQLMVNTSPELVERIGADGVHLSGERLHRLDRRPLPCPRWVAASCHGLEDLHQARRIGADFVVLGPVAETPSHPESPALGWEAFGSLCDEASMPVYALGGMALSDIPEARSRGGQGIAAIRALWRP